MPLPPSIHITTGRLLIRPVTAADLIQIPLKNPITVSPCMPIRYHLAHIALKRSLLLSADFGAVLSTYLHEIAHMFGPDGSASFSKALTALLEITLCNPWLIEPYREQWRSLPLAI